jgi:hypothetical protein
LARALAIASLGLIAVSAHAFPPYKLTDADTADPWTLEARLGLLQYTRDSGHEAYSSPLLRLNLGLPARTELLAETEYSRETDRVEEAAVGAKWIPWAGNPSFGIEALALLPRAGETRMGAEASVLMTVREDALLVHVNAGGFDDQRPEHPDRGGRAGLLVETRLGGLRPGAELFAKGPESEPEQVSAGVGLIVPFDSFDLRIGGRFGLTEAAPDFTASIWVSGALPLRSE